jgi:very-short-patch-repair endonuclease
MAIRYRSDLKPNSQKLRSKMTIHERLLWSQIRKKQIDNIQFLRQKPIGCYIVDFYAPDVQLVIEVDGSQHLEPEMLERDKIRDDYLRSLGLTVMRFENCHLEMCLDLVMEDIKRYILSRLERNSPTAPHACGVTPFKGGEDLSIRSYTPFEGGHSS